MTTPVEHHARAIKAAIKAAEDAGLTLELEVDTERDGEFGIALDVVEYRRFTDWSGRHRTDTVDWQEVFWEEREGIDD